MRVSVPGCARPTTTRTITSNYEQGKTWTDAQKDDSSKRFSSSNSRAERSAGSRY